MVVPLDLDRIQDALSTRSGWIELAVVLLCFALGWWFDHRVRVQADASSRMAKIGAGGVNRLIFPLTALVLLLIAEVALRRWLTPFFMQIAIPLAIALALIRLFIYGLYGLFGSDRPRPGSERAISFTIAGALLLYYVGILQQIVNALAEARIPIGRSEFSVLDLGRDLLVLVLALAVSLWVSGFVEQRLLRSSSGDVNARVVLSKLVRAGLILIGMLVALSMVGIDITVLSVFGGALGVGIGLGLQKLASNYIAGFTILLDRSVRIGDMITVDNRTGVVTKATARYVVVHGLDGIEAIVPNEILVTTTVLNHSYTTKNTRVSVVIQVRYGSDLDLALRLMEEAARAQPRVLGPPKAPAAFVNRFGDHGVELELVAWINDPENGQQNLRSNLNRAIWKAFQAHRIEVPLPQREVRLVGAGSDPAGGTLPPAEVSPESDR